MVQLRLEPYELLVIGVGEAPCLPVRPAPQPAGCRTELTGWTVSLARAKEYPAFGEAWRMEQLHPVSELYPDFFGLIRYETTFQSDGTPAVLELTDVRDCARVWCNGIPAGERICPPYRFALPTQPGENQLRIEVATNLEWAYQAMDVPKFSMQRPSAVKKPSSLIGTAALWTQEIKGGIHMKIEHLRANHFEQFLGMRSDPLELSWTVTEATGQKTARSRVRVAADADLQTVLFDSGWGDWDSLGYTPALELAPRTRYYWQVCCVSDDGEEGQSDTAWFETGKRDEDWQAAWITSPYEDDAHYYVARDFDAADVVSARAYVAAHGGYELYLNGEKVGDEYLAPGYYCYDDKDMVYTYDLGPYLQAHNRIGAMLAPSWFKGRFGLGFFRTRAYSNLYGKRMEFLCEIRLRMADGTERVIGTDAAWQCLPSPVTMSGIYDGEDYDARLETPGWCESGSANGTWSAAVPAAGTGVRLVDRSNPPIRVTETLKGTVITTPAGETILDFGQNLTGWYELDVDVPAGTEVVVRCCEVLEHGNWYRETLRSARAELHYISAGRPAHVRPHSTFFGFRYLKLEGAPLDPENLVAYVIHSDLPRTGWVETDNELVNRLISNAYWGQRDNFLDVPTDCPQRDERMGWTGDTQVFSDTACFNQYTPAFYAKWLEDLAFEQTLMNGGVPGTVPATKPSTGGQNMQMNSCGWGDAATVVPWNVYQHYGDKVQLARNYPSMRAYVDYLFRLDEADGGKRLWQTGHHTADWLALDNYKYPEAPQGGTDEHYIASAYYAHSSRIVARAASELGNTADAEKYRAAVAGDSRGHGAGVFHAQRTLHLRHADGLSHRAEIRHRAGDHAAAPVQPAAGEAV